jgi:hypothetical protein
MTSLGWEQGPVKSGMRLENWKVSKKGHVAARITNSGMVNDCYNYDNEYI